MNIDKHRFEMKTQIIEMSLRCANRSSAPKALNMIAQGNALGFGSQKFIKP